mgnify:CR=1 FL=1
MSWKNILKKGKSEKRTIGNVSFTVGSLEKVGLSTTDLEEFYEVKLKTLFDGNYDESPYSYYLGKVMYDEIDDKTFLEGLNQAMEDKPYEYEDEWGDGGNYPLRNNNLFSKKDFLAFLDKYLSQKKYVDKAKEHVEYYARELYGV